MANKSDAKTVEVTLKAPHRHAGRNHVKGDKVRVSPQAKEKLAKLGVI